VKRFIDKHLAEWKADRHRKALLLRGARQVGKTFSVRQLGASFPEFVEINFELTPEFARVFEHDLEPERIIRDLRLLTGRKIIPGQSLLFFDEVQEAPQAVRALRYFYEKIPELHVVAAGSLLDFTLEKIGLPVGRVASLHLYPLSFFEFLLASGQEALAGMLLNHEPAPTIDEVVHQRLIRLLGEYLAVGGMPSVINIWVDTGDPARCSKEKALLANSYRQDFQKFAGKHQVKHLDLIFDEVPGRLGQKFVYSRLPGTWRARELAPALDLLCKAGVVHKVVHSSGGGLPLSVHAKPDHFKPLFLDVGLAQSVLGLDDALWLLDPETATLNKGSLIEAFVGQELMALAPPWQKERLFFWHREARGSSAEVDYLMALEGNILPVEVKSGAHGHLKSLHIFLAEHERQSPRGIRFSTRPFSVRGAIHDYPLYAVTCLFRDRISRTMPTS
jgi:hypothetical protein